MKNPIFFLLLTMLFLALSILSPSFAADGKQTIQLTEAEQRFLLAHPTIVLGAGSEWEPYVIVAKDGTVSGFDADILARINTLTGANFQIQPGDWADVQQRTYAKELDGLCSVALTEERKTHLIFSNPYISQRTIVLVPRGNPGRITSLQHLNGRSIAITAGTQKEEELVRHIPGAVIHPTASLRESIEAIISGRADAMFGSGTVLYHAYKYNLPFLQIAFPLDETLHFSFAIRSDWPEAVSILNKALAAIPAEEYQRLRSFWFNPLPEKTLLGTEFELSREERDYLVARGPITLCTDPDWAPYISIDDTGDIQGVFAGLHRVITQKIGKEAQVIRTASWAQSLDYARERKCDVLLAAMDTPERRDYLNFSSTLLTIPKVIATRTDKLFIDNLDRLKGETLAIVEGYATIDYLKAHHPDIRIRAVGNPQEGLRLVHESEAFGYVDSVLNIAAIIQQQQYLDLKISGQLDKSQDYVLGVGIRDDDPLLLSVYNKAIATISEQDRQKLLDQAVSVRYDLGFDYMLLWQITAAIIVVALLCVFLAYLALLRNRRKELELQVAQRTRELVEKNRDIETMLAELEQKNSELERFAYTVSHDLKSPLVTISCFVDLLELDLGNDIPAQVRSHLGFIRSAGNKMNALLSDLLELSRTGRTVNLVDKVSLAEVTAEAVELLRGKIDACSADIRISGRLPQVKGDAKRLGELMQNLIENAIKYANPLTRPKIEIGAENSEKGWTCYVKDNGIGIPAAYHERVFGLFERLHTDQEGTGIGLALVKRIVELHGGKVWIESAGENQGTTVWFTLPPAV